MENKNQDTGENPEEEIVNIDELVDELEKSYDKVPRGTIYEAVASIKVESFLINYLKDQQIANTVVESELTLGDLFSSSNNKELKSVVKFGKKTGLSKVSTVAAALALVVGKVIYDVYSNDEVKAELEEIDINHSKKMIENAKNLTKDSQSEQNKDGDKQKETKGNKK